MSAAGAVAFSGCTSLQLANYTAPRDATAMPRGDLPGWHQVLADNFDGSSLRNGWFNYSGPIPSMPGGNWSGSQVRVSGGMMTLGTSKVNGAWTSGAVMNSSAGKTTYGKYAVRLRIDRANGVKYALVLWPASGRWPGDGEIDFGEDEGGGRGITTASVVYSNGGSAASIQRHVNADFSQWHTIGVEWTPGKLVYTLDGKPWASVASSVVPHVPMSVAIQTEAGSCHSGQTCLDWTTPAVTHLDVDWVSVYTRK